MQIANPDFRVYWYLNEIAATVDGCTHSSRTLPTQNNPRDAQAKFGGDHPVQNLVFSKKILLISEILKRFSVRFGDLGFELVPRALRDLCGLLIECIVRSEAQVKLMLTPGLDIERIILSFNACFSSPSLDSMDVRQDATARFA